MKLENIKLPNHIAFILDGNGRWAQRIGKSRNYGHQIGVETLKTIVKEVMNIGIPYMSVYAFSTENMERPIDEVTYLMNLAKEEFDKIQNRLNDLNYNIRIIGEDTNLSEEILKIKKTINNVPFKDKTFTLFIAFNYSSKLEILNAAKNSNSLEELENKLYTSPANQIDLLIRTSGEKRLSNFMLYQAAYAELYFDKIFWPAYNKKHLLKALKWYSKRKRNFGKI